MTFYHMRRNSEFEPRWTFAISVDRKPPEIHWTCPDCGRGARYPAGGFDVTVEEGTSYPDILGCGFFPLLVVSERVLNDWNRAGINPGPTFPVGVVDALETELKPADAPAYFRVEVTGSAKVDVRASGGVIQDMCPRCGGFKTAPLSIKRFSLFEGSWDGSPIFRDHRLFPGVTLCTEEVKQLAEACHHTNFRFDEMLFG